MMVYFGEDVWTALARLSQSGNQTSLEGQEAGNGRVMELAFGYGYLYHHSRPTFFARTARKGQRL